MNYERKGFRGHRLPCNVSLHQFVVTVCRFDRNSCKNLASVERGVGRHYR
jgi:hypothetical protein